MNRLTLILTIALFTSSLGAKECPLEGFWKSNEAKTLASLEVASNVTEKQRELFSKDFFGKLFMQIKCSEYTAVLEDWYETTPYELISSKENVVILKYESILDEGFDVMEATISGDCYSVPINSGQFREYLCRTTKEAYNKMLQSADSPCSDIRQKRVAAYLLIAKEEEIGRCTEHKGNRSIVGNARRLSRQKR